MIKDGTIKRHIKKATNHYRVKRDFTAALLTKLLKEKAAFDIPDGGLAIWIAPKKKVDWQQVITKLENQGIKFLNPGVYSFDSKINGFRLGYGSLSEKELEEGIIALGKQF